MKLVYVFASGTLAFSTLANAELKFNSNFMASYVNDSSKSEAFSRRKSNILTLQPSLGAVYTAKKVQGAANVKYIKVNNNASGGASDIELNQNNTFTSFDYNGRLNVIENVLTLSAVGAQSYNNTIAGNALVNDELFGSQELSKTQRNTASFNFNLSQGDWIGLGMGGSYSNVKSDRQVYTDSKLDSDNTSLNAQIYSGDEVKLVNWNLVGTYNETNGSGFNDSISQMYQGDFRVGLFSELNLVFTGQSEKNEISSTDTDSTSNFDYNSYGLGLSWYHSAQRFIDVTYNRSTRDEDETQGFLGLKFNWRFTSRTSIHGEYGRRFYGESGSLGLSHKTRKIRTEITYEEDVTNYTRLIAGDVITGSFVCPIGSSDILQCFQPPSINYELQPGEEYSNFSFIVPEISEAEILRKSFIANIGYSFRKVNSNLTFRNTNTEYLDGSREQQTQTISLNNSLQMNRKSTLSGSLTYTRFDNTVDEDRLSADNDEVLSANINFTRKINRDLNATISYQHTLRRSPVQNRDFDSDRISLQLKYKLF
ncbi:TIGR03016 family PEP-CTERM system-associated outer membrane protein [Aliiglaciecola sp. NS0011-25]|uniref:TIGR03016 family PEP-CTERM system-associated outer membrane protein n=1 Tax=Aliiglaciecola sp. NS0011-25 TaxID=3127654 RepID=UPI00310767FC